MSRGTRRGARESTLAPIYQWTAHPMKTRPERLLLGGLLILLLAAMTVLFAGSWWWGLVALVILVLATNRFFFPSTFVIDEEGITAKYPLRTVRYRWRELRRFVHDENGGHLSTRGKRSFIDAYSGIHLLFDAQREEAVAQIRQMMNDGKRAEGA